MPRTPGWKLSRPRPIHFKLAEYLTQGLSPKDCARLTGISIFQVYRLRGCPLIQQMVAQARQYLLEADALAAQGLDAFLTREELKLLADLAQIRDFSPNAEHRLSACIKSMRLLEKIRDRQDRHKPEEIRIRLNLPPDLAAKLGLPDEAPP